MKSMKERKIYLKKKETNFTFIYVCLNAILIYQKLFMTSSVYSNAKCIYNNNKVLEEATFTMRSIIQNPN